MPFRSGFEALSHPPAPLTPGAKSLRPSVKIARLPRPPPDPVPAGCTTSAGFRLLNEERIGGDGLDCLICMCGILITFSGRMGEMVDLLCLDVDGTLLDSRKELLQENVEAVRFALGKGVTVAIASGRSVLGIQPLIDQLGIGRCGVCLNGGLVLCGDVIFRDLMEEELVMRIIDQAERFHSQIFLSAAEFNITNGALSDHLKDLVDKGSLRSDYRFCSGYDELRREAHDHKDEIIKVAIKEIDDVNFDLLKQALMDMDLFHVAKSDTFFVDINPKNSNKGKGVAVLADHLSVPLERVMCIGDNENDLEMVGMAGIGVAMGNAVESVRSAAGFVTGDNDHCGVAEAVYRFIR